MARVYRKKPVTVEAVQMVMERMEKLHEDNGCS